MQIIREIKVFHLPSFLISFGLYLTGLLLNFILAENYEFPYYILPSTATICLILFYKRLNGIAGLLAAVISWFSLSFFNIDILWGLAHFEFIFFFIAELASGLIFVRLLKRYFEPLAIVEQKEGAVLLIAGSLLSSIPQSVILTIFFLLKNDSSEQSIQVFQNYVLSFSILLLLISSLVFSIKHLEFSKFKDINIRYVLISFIIILVLISLYKFFQPFGNDLWFIAVATLLAIVITGMLVPFKQLMFNILLFTVLLFMGILPKEHTEFINILYFKYLVFTGVGLSIFVHAIITEKNQAIASLKEGYRNIEKDVQLQNQYYRSLNVKLLEEIEQKAIIQRELSLNRRLLEDSQEIAGIANWELNPITRQIRWSENAYKIIGVESNDKISNFNDYIKTIHPEDVKILNEVYKKALKSSEKFEAELRHLKSDGTINHLLIRGRSFEEQGAVNRIVGLSFDITSRKLAEIMLQEANTLKDQLFSILAHDLRSPIGSINQITSYLVDNIDTLDTLTRTDILNSIKDTSGQTYSLLENLLEWAKSQKQSSYNPVHVNVSEVLDESISLLSGMVTPKMLNIETILENNLAVFADRQMFKTVIRNLLSNAIKFTPKMGKITITGKSENNQTIIAIADSGKGIPVDQINNIFDSKFNFTTLGTENEKGSGLGLKLVKTFIDRNGGSIAVKSEPNLGTTFSIVLPSG